MENSPSDSQDFILHEEDLIFPTMPNRDLITKYIDIYKNLQTSDKLKEPLYRVLRSDWLYGAPFTDRVHDAEDLLPSIEKMKSRECLYDALKLVRFIWDWQNSFFERRISFENRKRTANARKSRRMNIKFLEDIEDYFLEVENIWHPVSTDEKGRLIRNQRNSREKAVAQVFKKNEVDITNILIKHGYKSPFLERFERLFQTYIEYYVQCLGTTPNGYFLERRASRSEESKKRSRQAAKKHMLKSKKHD